MLLYVIWPQPAASPLSLDRPNGKLVIRVASSFFRRGVGLLNHASLERNSGLLLMGVRNIHTVGMAFEIDVVFLDREHKVLSVEKKVVPGRVVRGPRGCRHTLELAAGAADFFSIAEGEFLLFR